MNRGQPQQSFPQPSDFLKQGNYDALLNYTRKSIADSQGELTDKTDRRLQSVLNHYMKEVAKQNPGKKIQELNRETIRETLTSMEGWLRRGGESVPTNGDMYRQPETERLYSNVGTQLASQQKERSLVVGAPAIKPDFRDKVEEDVIDPMALFEKARLAREKEGMMKPASKPDLVLRDDSPEYKVPQNLPQDVIIRQQDITKYKEVEYNIFLNSGDRNWILNTTENRYEFSINFNVANNANTFPISPSVQERFRNIVRIETVKVVVPLESLETILQVAAGSPPVYATNPIVSALSYQYVALRIAELNTNGFGTNSKLDNSFAIMHQDTQWVSDSSAASANRGYASLTPKYLKCQKIYAPTPLGSLQKLSIRIENPTGSTLSQTSDVQGITQIVFSSDLTAYNSAAIQSTLYITAPGTQASPGTVTASNATTNEYVFIRCTNWFSKWQVNYPDKIVISNFVVGGTATGASIDFTNWITRSEGHYVVGLAFSSGAAGTVTTDGQNVNGFSNWVIIKNRFNDPTLTASYRYPSSSAIPYLTRQYFGGSVTTEITLGATLYGATSNQVTAATNAALLNLNHQTHIVLRVVCREMDGASNLRPDNTN